MGSTLEGIRAIAFSKLEKVDDIDTTMEVVNDDSPGDVAEVQFWIAKATGVQNGDASGGCNPSPPSNLDVAANRSINGSAPERGTTPPSTTTHLPALPAPPPSAPPLAPLLSAQPPAPAAHPPAHKPAAQQPQ